MILRISSPQEKCFSLKPCVCLGERACVFCEDRHTRRFERATWAAERVERADVCLEKQFRAVRAAGTSTFLGRHFKASLKVRRNPLTPVPTISSNCLLQHCDTHLPEVSQHSSYITQQYNNSSLI